MNFQRGDSVCSNRVRVRRDVLERDLLAGLEEKVLREDVVAYVLNRFEAELVRELQAIGGEIERMKRRKSELHVEIGRLAAGLASGSYSPAIMAEVVKREQEVADISNRLLSSSADSVRVKAKGLR
jgi:site-specific DNA recombinase